MSLQMIDPIAEYYNQIVCAHQHDDGKQHRFSHVEDCDLHIKMVHGNQPSNAELMEMLEHILITVSIEGDKENGK